MLLVIVEEDAGGVSAASLEAVTCARHLAEGTGLDLHAAAFGAHGDLAAGLSKYGVSTLHLVTSDATQEYSPELWGAALAELVEHTGVTGVLAASTDRGNELLANAAASADQPFASNCVAIEPGDPWNLTRQRGGGILLEDAELSGRVKLASLVPGSVEISEATTTHEVDVLEFVPAPRATMPHSVIVDRTSRGSGVSLATARVVVSGGRGVGSAEGFAPLEELAELLGGAVGCSRVATNNGWRSHSDQVGLTGTKIGAELYIACGISGATQHWVGCMGAKTILAINTDPEAPLVARADYAVIGDVQEVLGAVLERVRARRAAA
ncbi:electron transfer flavoprotein subunit alpha/FixB family protein [Haloechinothrix sp. YIM 98757]|uniref:Electron transfer flavoprotein subunit alpha/FixB family protein n=1 Tax=Haloechinothrix aidingensis TaxID=2752311 RepID=A0A838A944_9PSEU|nr:electron transfer flavoprotein subunit alpha/FixB family protein [Haloechinothrix aidingensis]MBA0125052.1 electron transfer flavoprotein subunit alpha/FixB family protein [Haloechinothrix aidingensis]